MSYFEISVGTLSRGLNPVDVLVDTAPVLFDEEGLQIQTVDESNVAAVGMHLSPEAFDEYDTDSVELHLDIKQLTQILTRFDNDSTAIVQYAKDNGQDLTLSIGSFEFDLSPIHPESVRSGRKAGDVDPPAEIVIEAGEVQKAVKLADMFSDELILGIDASRSVFYINSIGDSDNMAVSFTEDHDSVDRIDLRSAHGTYSRQYLKKMTKFVPQSDSLHIELGEEYPAKLSFGSPKQEGQITYGLAPRVNEY